jgi:hypothetical protein
MGNWFSSTATEPHLYWYQQGLHHTNKAKHAADGEPLGMMTIVMKDDIITHGVALMASVDYGQLIQ